MAPRELARVLNHAAHVTPRTRNVTLPVPRPMIESRRTWLYIAFLAGVLAVGIPYWLMPYGQVNLPSALLTPALGVVVAAAFLARIGRTASFWRVVLVVGSTVPAAVFLRVVWDTTRNPTSHNLWPFEVIIALMVGLCCSLSGAAAGMIGAMIKTPQPAERRS